MEAIKITTKTQEFQLTGQTTCKNCGTHKDWGIDAEGYVTCKLCWRKRGRNRPPEKKRQYLISGSLRRKQVPIKTRLELTKSRCKKLDREYNLTSEFIVQLFIKQDNKCALSGEPINPQDFSIDRIDSSKGYTTDNVQLVKLVFNQMKSNLPDKQFIEYCRIVANYHASD